MNAVELKVLEVKQPEVLFNEQEISNYLSGILESYEGLVFTDDTVKYCKATVTELNKMIKAVDGFRLKYKKELLEPITAFENKCKMLIAQIEGVQEPLKLQADNFEIKRKAERRTEVEGYIAEVLEIVKLEEKWASRLTLKDEWLNVSLSNSKCKKAIVDEAEKLQAEQKSYYDKKEVVNTKSELYSMKFGLEIPLIPENFYHLLDNFDGVEIDRRIYEIAEKTKANEVAAIERIQRQAEEKARIEATQQVAEIVEQVQVFIPVEHETQEKTFSVTLKIKATKSQMDSLKAYMDASGIEYGRVNK